jgi:hypothetical protein
LRSSARELLNERLDHLAAFLADLTDASNVRSSGANIEALHQRVSSPT